MWRRRSLSPVFLREWNFGQRTPRDYPGQGWPARVRTQEESPWGLANFLMTTTPYSPARRSAAIDAASTSHWYRRRAREFWRAGVGLAAGFRALNKQVNNRNAGRTFRSFILRRHGPIVRRISLGHARRGSARQDNRRVQFRRAETGVRRSDAGCYHPGCAAPIAWARAPDQRPGHTATVFRPGGGEFANVASNWLLWTIQ
jgi:hypothetical protein